MLCISDHTLFPVGTTPCNSLSFCLKYDQCLVRCASWCASHMEYASHCKTWWGHSIACSLATSSCIGKEKWDVCGPLSMKDAWALPDECHVMLTSLLCGRNVLPSYISLRLDGRVRASGVGFPPFEIIAAQLPPMRGIWAGPLDGMDGQVWEEMWGVITCLKACGFNLVSQKSEFYLFRIISLHELVWFF